MTKKITLQVMLTFHGTVTVIADSERDAVEIIEEKLHMTISGGVHADHSSPIEDWEIDSHASTKVILPPVKPLTLGNLIEGEPDGDKRNFYRNGKLILVIYRTGGFDTFEEGLLVANGNVWVNKDGSRSRLEKRLPAATRPDRGINR